MRTPLLVAIAALLVLAGWGANDIITARRFVVLDRTGEALVAIGADALGGFIMVRDINGSEVFKVQGGQVHMPANARDPVGSPGETAPSSKSTSGRVAQLIEVTPQAVDPAIHGDMAELIASAEDLEAKAREMERQAGALKDKERRSRPIRRWDHHWERWVEIGVSDPIGNATLRAELREQALELKKIARRKRGKARKLERVITVPRQRIRAWIGDREIIFISKGDLSRHLVRIPRNGFFEWTGSAGVPSNISIYDTDLEIYEVRTIKPAARPAEWKDAP